MRILALLPLLAACAAPAATPTVHAFRLLPGQDLLAGIEEAAQRHAIDAGWVAAAVGSLTDCALRFADRPQASHTTGRFEIVSLCGTVSRHGSHLHLAVSDAEGRTIGGHLVPGCRVYTTAEIVLCVAPDHVFTRAHDGTTPWAELQIRRRQAMAADGHPGSAP
ncbi:MAG: DNA-binding protein [Planctomycetes bacterium]|nr:DNA-binding protein [Planctomycetota bacterium]